MTRHYSSLLEQGIEPSTFKPWLPLSIIVIAIVSCFAIAATAPVPAEKPQGETAVNVNVMTITPSVFTPSYSAYGSVIADNKLTLSAQVDGQLTYLSSNLVEGGIIGLDELVYRQDDADLNAILSQRQAQWEMARAQLALEQGEQRIAEKDYQMMQQDFKDNDWKIDLDLLLRQPQLSQAKAELNIAHNALKISERDLSRSQWLSDKRYVVESKNATQGDYLSKGDKVATLVDISQLRVPIYLPRAQASQLQLGQTISLTQPDTGQSFNAKISHIVPILDPSSQLQKIFAQYQAIPQQNSALIIGDFVKANITFAPINDTVRIPLAAIDNDQVWLVGPNKTLQAKAINVLHQDESHAVINNVFTENEYLITSKLHRPLAGLTANIVENF
ncbi:MULTISPECIES: efflux RND transporter periplasmic adaptor subunit [unclassified Shewanella]|uniref:efflux RND transporter periplasmic adaptor subunit n=1 Tax=unclassified Shewanella TaxID=196818 RepID=UPI001BC638FB|nr:MULTISPECIES: HlyD family efflux transporter periplasmic adaptor subunit [unclassified Shewanella]GIU05001.1 multidrug resistance protein MdtA [Shewanella sp. MBTL60-112-B1]GIU24529.1 multidrug resistance protein MdtA [Shewanella sp. MBTL60-112-B2]